MTALRRPIMRALAIGSVTPAVAFLAWACVALTMRHKQLTPIWAANGLALTALLLAPWRYWGWIVAAAVGGNLIGNAAAGATPILAFGLSVTDAIEYLACAYIVRRILGAQVDLSQPRHLTWFVIASVVSVLGSALISSLMLHALGRGMIMQNFTLWILANSLGLLIITPALTTLARRPDAFRANLFDRISIAAIAAIAAMVVAVFHFGPYPFLFFVPPLVLLLAVRMEALGAMIGVAVTAITAVLLSAAGVGSLDNQPMGAVEKAIALQLFLAVTTLTALFVAAMATRGRRLQQEAVAARDAAREQSRRAEMAEGVVGLGHWRMDLHDQGLTCSRQMFDIFGVDENETNLLELSRSIIVPADRARLKQELISIVTGKAPMNDISISIVRPDGAARRLSIRMRLDHDDAGVPAAIFGTTLDITAQVASETALAESEARFRLLAENATDLVLQCNTRGVLTYVSPSSKTLLGYDSEGLAGRNALDFLVRQDVRAMLDSLIAQGAQAGGKPARIEYRIRKHNGETAWFEGQPVIVRDPNTDRITGITDIVRDITARKALEAQLHEARVEAEAAAAAKAEFLANMSHELRTPLTAVIGFSEMAARRPGQDVQTVEYLELVTTAGRALLATVNDILEFSKLEAGQVEINAVDVDPRGLAERTVALFSIQAAQKGLTLCSTGIGTLPPSVRIDADRVRQVLLNLLGNAVKFTETGEVRLDAAYDADTQMLRIQVADTGPGIPPEDMEKLFKRFSQIDGSSTRAHGGTGLGLAICKGLVEAMGGGIAVDSTPGQGSCFSFYIPAPVGQAEIEEAEAAPPAMAGRRILFADDNLANRQLVHVLLNAVGVDVRLARDGLEALSLAEAETFDAILLDLRMPGLDGEGVARRLRADEPEGARRPIIAFSAGAATPALMEVFDAWVGKPVIPETLLATLSALVSETAPAPRKTARQAAKG
ncbi:ATP-binding protein [Caulobacter segnis]|uniref:ATP-binding protein n=1 Tax=Caulobacter segnis TaxID=88688 RepID=UPI00240FE42B|nr:ATP-binding protein [Caulobacter segnis]MDG2520774.1 ATP-binding protein [Caulobacter segnis]